MGEPDTGAAGGPLERLLASVDFDLSPRSRESSRHVVEETVGRTAQLSRVSVARRVFKGRTPSILASPRFVRIQEVRLRRSREPVSPLYVSRRSRSFK